MDSVCVGITKIKYTAGLQNMHVYKSNYEHAGRRVRLSYNHKKYNS